MNYPGQRLATRNTLYALWLLALIAWPAVAKPAASDKTAARNSASFFSATNIDRPLRYWPIGTDFVITNGAEFFNRPLYCLNSAFRIDGGDKPEFSLYLPGRGGNLRFGIKTSAGVKWLNDAQTNRRALPSRLDAL